MADINFDNLPDVNPSATTDNPFAGVNGDLTKWLPIGSPASVARRQKLSAEYSHTPFNPPSGTAAAIAAGVGSTIGGPTESMKPIIQQNPIGFAVGLTIPKVAVQGLLTAATGGTSIPAQMGISATSSGGVHLLQNPGDYSGAAKEGALSGIFSGIFGSASNSANYLASLAGRNITAARLSSLGRVKSPENEADLISIFGPDIVKSLKDNNQDIFDFAKMAADEMKQSSPTGVPGISQVVPGATADSVSNATSAITKQAATHVSSAVLGGGATATLAELSNHYFGTNYDPYELGIEGAIGTNISRSALGAYYTSKGGPIGSVLRSAPVSGAIGTTTAGVAQPMIGPITKPISDNVKDINYDDLPNQ
jgi:hypothetical protein